MRPTTWLRPKSLLCLALCLNLVAARHLGDGLYLRQDDATPTTTTAEPTTTTTPPPESTSTGDAATTDITKSDKTQTATTTNVPTNVPSSINGNNYNNSTFDDPSVPAGQLPLPPKLTPGWGVAGAILLTTGLGYTLIGIKNSWLQTFFSSAYLAALCTSILIVYVSAPPVSAGIQGAYVVACVCAGVVIGGGATLFRELTEGFGCLLGGFSLSMWLLTLKAGGLLSGSTAKIIFIAVFTVVGYALYFSHYTRGYAMIGLISFAGATVTTLGIDCFSRAGLKEFWAYIWALNNKLFPLGADTYPQTKGITVETALIVLLTVAGIISQLKLWRVIQDRRTKRDEELEVEQRQRDEEEAQVGRDIEEENKRERRRWEAAHGNPDAAGSVVDSGDSGYEYDKEKKVSERRSQTTVRTAACDEKEIELSDLGPSRAESQSSHRKSTNEVIAGDDGKITVRVARDEIPEQQDQENGALPTIHEPEEKEKPVWIMGSNGEVRRASTTGPPNADSPRDSNASGPSFVPLPFRVPVTEEQDKDDDDRSSFATMADDEERSVNLSRRGSAVSAVSMSKRLSVGSTNLLRSLSHKSIKAKRRTGEFESPLPSPKFLRSESKEDLVTPPGDSPSVAATQDDMSTDGSQIASNAKDGESAWSKDILAELGDRSEKAASEFGASEKSTNRQLRPKTSGTHLEVRRASFAGSLNTADEPKSPTIAEPKSPTIPEESVDPKSKRISTNTAAESAAVKSSAQGNSDDRRRSAAPSAVSTSASLTKDRLPSGLSRVALSYRTNEWAKHLSHAETPEPEQLQLQEQIEQHEDEQPKAETGEATSGSEKKDKNEKPEEMAVPVNVNELQQSTESGIPPAHIIRSASSASQIQPNPHSGLSQASLSGSPAPGTNPSALAALNGQQEQQLQARHSFRSKVSGMMRRKSSDMAARPIAEESVDNTSSPTTEQEQPQSPSRNSGVVSYNSPQTLLGQREMLLRNKSTSLLPQATIPEEPPATYYPSSPPSEFGGSVKAVPIGGSIYRMSHSVSTPLINQAQNSGYQPPSPDADDLPLAQRRNLMRHGSTASMAGPNGTSPPIGQGIMRSSSAMSFHQAPTLLQQQQQMKIQQQQQAVMTAENAGFNSHQPQRHSSVASASQREAQLASFRSSVAADLRAGPNGGLPLANQQSINNGSSNSASAMPGSDGAPLTGLVANIPSGPSGTVPTNSGPAPLGGRFASGSLGAADAATRANMEQSRQTLMSQREAEAARLQQAQAEKERSERAFEEMMRSGGLMDAHRDAMRKMQMNVNKKRP